MLRPPGSVDYPPCRPSHPDDRGALKLDATGNERTNTCAAGCALSLSLASAMVAAGRSSTETRLFPDLRAATPRGELATNGAVKSIYVRSGGSIDQVEFKYRSGTSRRM